MMMVGRFLPWASGNSVWTHLGERLKFELMSIIPIWSSILRMSRRTFLCCRPVISAISWDDIAGIPQMVVSVAPAAMCSMFKV